MYPSLPNQEQVLVRGQGLAFSCRSWELGLEVVVNWKALRRRMLTQAWICYLIKTLHESTSSEFQAMAVPLYELV